MTRQSRSWIAPYAAATLLVAACALMPAQGSRTQSFAPKGALAGRLTDLRSQPLAGITVVARNAMTGEEARVVTARNGSYRFAGLDAGEYTLAAESARLGRGHVDGVVVFAGREAHVQTAMDMEPEGPAAVLTAESTVRLQPGSIPMETDGAAPRQIERAPAAQPMRVTVDSEQVRQAAETAVTTRQEKTQLPANASHPLAQPAPSSQPSAGTSASAVPVGPRSEGVSPPAHNSMPADAQTASLIAPAAVPLRSTAAADLSTSLAASTSASSRVVPMIRAHPAQLLPIAAAVAKADPVIPALQTTVSETEIAALPEPGRNWQNFALDTPTAAAPAVSSQTSFRGENQAPAEITVDGAPTRLAFGTAANTEPNAQRPEQQGGSSAMGQAWNGGRGFGVSEAGVREVQTVAGNVESEFARGTGGRIALKTAHGENQVHGQAFLFDRQNTWGAQNPFTQLIQNTGTAAVPIFSPVSFTPPDHEITLGAGLGGRLRRDKLFWFAALDSYRRNDPGISTVRNPTEFFSLPEPTSPDVVLLSAQLNESFNQAYNDFLGVANGAYTPAGLEQLQSLLGPASRSAAQWVGFARIDWQAAERHRITLEGIGANWNAPGGGMTRLSENYGNHSYGSSEANEQWLLARWEAYLSPNLLTTTQASAGRNVLNAKPDAPSAFEQTLLKGNAWGQLPQIVVDSRYGFTIGNPSRYGQGSYPDEKLYHAQQLVDWVHNRLLIKAGVELDHNNDATSMLRNQTGTYHYSKVQNFISDALAFEKFGLTNLFDAQNPHNCNPPQNSLGALPCYSYYSQMMGPANWHLSTNDWAGFATAQLQLSKLAVVSFGMRWEREQMPPPIAAVDNPELPQTEKLPDLGNNWGPRISFAAGDSKGHWPLLRLGYGMYYGRTENATLETVLTQTGSLKGDLNFFIRPTDGYFSYTGTSDAPPFPYVLQGLPSKVVKPGAVEFASNFRNPEVHQAVVSVEQSLPGHILVTAAAMASLGRRLPISIDTNIDPAVNPGTLTAANPGITYAVKDPTGQGPIKKSQITVPFYASWPYADCVGNPHADPVTGQCGRLNPDYQQIAEIMSRANSTYEAATVKIARYGRRGMSLHAHYTYAHAMDWNPNETTLVSGSDVLNPADFSQEYGVSNLDVRHSAAATVIYGTPWKRKNIAGLLANGWMLSSIGQFRGGLPYTMRVTGAIPQGAPAASGNKTVGLGPSMNGFGGDNRLYGLARNTFRYPHTWKADLRMSKRFNLGKMRDLELMAETFNLFNRQNVTELETTGYSIESGSSGSLPTLCYLTTNTTLDANGCGAQTTSGSGIFTAAFGKPLSINGSDYFRERQLQFGMRMRF